jgi:hypothetical protein
VRGIHAEGPRAVRGPDDAQKSHRVAAGNQRGPFSSSDNLVAISEKKFFLQAREEECRRAHLNLRPFCHSMETTGIRETQPHEEAPLSRTAYLRSSFQFFDLKISTNPLSRCRLMPLIKVPGLGNQPIGRSRKTNGSSDHASSGHKWLRYGVH